ncbi:IPT/TIG domain-containing protein [Pendulispora brunnea]|uniref:IPT/TIG domain-containing protein n=1 Tax=Pendulispora brunnea TaxID=2905690 RepID=A0ABZ2KAU2_9BACT
MMDKQPGIGINEGGIAAPWPWSKPTVAGVGPNCGPSAGGTRVTILGKGFINATAVHFGSVGAQNFNVESDTEMTATSPAYTAGGSVDITVTTSKGTSPANPPADQFTFLTSTNTTQVMMTLAGLAATGAAERPSGETVEQQQARILAGINAQLANSNLSTANNWQAIWVGLTQDRANLVYIAENPSNSGGPTTYAVCLRGTVGGSPIDSAEDMDVGSLLPFGPFGSGGPLGNISQGAMMAFTEIIMGTTLMATLTPLITAQSSGPTIYVTGHSLGGALATTISLYLAAQTWTPKPTLQVFTFAAPTAGDGNFASSFNAQFPQATCAWNQYDLVPNAWQNLVNGESQNPPTPESVEFFYPRMNSPLLSAEVKKIVQNIASKTPVANPYTQPTQQPALNAYFACTDPDPSDISTLDDWLAEVAYQHANDTYLMLLGAPTLPAVAPSIASITPSSGPVAGGTQITITPLGVTFSADSQVDFGVVPATSVEVNSNGTITATSPPGIGTVDVRVTNMFGTSTVVAADQFTFTP